MKNNYGLQLYSVRDYLANDFKGGIEKVAEMGYKYLEFAGFYGYSAEDVKAIMDNCGVTCSGTHSSLEGLLPENIMETIKYHKTIGDPNYIVPGADLTSLEKIERFAAIMNYAKPVFAAEGIKLGYHNHSHEFVVMPWGSTIHSEIERRTDIDFEIDTFWAFNAGVDPIALLDRLKARVNVIHLKDGLKGGIGRSLGLGEAPVADVRKKALERGLTIVVESENLDPNGIEEVRRCMDYLKSLEK